MAAPAPIKIIDTAVEVVARRDAAATAMLSAPRVPAPSRRAFLAGLSAPALAATLPVAAQAALATEHPDQALFEAEAAYREAEQAYYVARDRSRAAHDAYEADLGLAPAELVLTEDDRYLTLPHCYAVPPLRRMRLAWARADLPGDESPHQIWTVSALYVAIANGPAALGRAGRTPHHIRRWRSLLPAAEAFDARRSCLGGIHRVPALEAETREADKTRIATETRLSRLQASTLEGLAVKVRHLDDCNWMGMGQPWISLLQSAAAVAGVELRRPTFDCARWARELLTRLSQEEREHGDEIRFWLSQGGLA